MKKTNWATRAYQTTRVPWTQSQAQIYKMLGELGIYEIRFTNLRDSFMLEFLVSVAKEKGAKPRGVRIKVPLKYTGESEEKRRKELNIVHRVLFFHLKSKFVAIQGGLTEFEEEFMAHLIITDGHGNSTTLGQRLLPEYRKQIEEGKAGEFKLLPGGDDDK
jgi:hypothetical protein